MPLPRNVFKAFGEDDSLCVVQCLWQYEKVTHPFCQSALAGCPQPLFLLCEASQTSLFTEASSWIKSMLAGAGVDTESFKVYSVRGASSSAAVKGVHINGILQTADWSKDSTFKQFYYCPVANQSTEPLFSAFCHNYFNHICSITLCHCCNGISLRDNAF